MSLHFVQHVSILYRDRFFPLEHTHNVCSICIYACVWFFLYRCVLYVLNTRPLSLDNNRLFSQYVVSVLHCVLVSCMSLIVLSGPLRQEWVWAYTGYSELMMNIFCSYLLSDFFIEFFAERNPLFLLHHCIVFTVYVYSATRPFAHYICAGFILWECSTLFLSLRRILLELRLHRTRVFQYVEQAFVVSFVLVRIVFGFYFSYQALKVLLFYHTKRQIPVVVGLLSVSANAILHTMNVYWLSIIYKKFLAQQKKQS